VVNLFLKDLLAFNGIAVVITLILFGLGWSIMDAIFISLLALCALLLIAGGVIGFLLSSVSFGTLMKYFRRGGQKEEPSGEMHDKEQDRKNKEKREQVNTGKMMVIIGLVLFGESLLISLILLI
jgi:hypothetical protein